MNKENVSVNSTQPVGHTPGPWDLDIEGSKWFIDGADELTVAYLDREGFREKGEIEANARLIAAAPELLAACKSALRALEDNLDPGPMDSDAKTALRLVIAKTEGRTP